MDTSKISIILKYEFVNGIKKKSFLFITFFMPALMIFIFASKTSSMLDKGVVEKKFMVINNSYLSDSIKSNSSAKFEYVNMGLEEGKKELLSGQYKGLIIINENVETIDADIYTLKQIGLSECNHIKSEFKKLYSNLMLRNSGIDMDEINKSSEKNVQVQVVNIDDGQHKDPTIPSALAYLSTFIMYLCIFQFSSMVMKNISIEKNNKVVEILLSSTKTIELITGKIIGVGLLGLLQFLVWIIIFGIMVVINNTMSKIDIESMELFTNFLLDFNLNSYIIYFLLYFIGGYFLYSSLFAALGSIVNQHTDSQQFILPVVLPLMLTFIYSCQYIGVDNHIVNFLSYLPVTSPIAMLFRLPFKVALYEIIISLLFLYGFIFFVIYYTSKIYKEGILNYNSRITYYNIQKWLKKKK